MPQTRKRRHPVREVRRNGQTVLVKYCRRCRRVKEVEEFHVNGVTPTGKTSYRPMCKVCTDIVERRKWAALPIEKRREINRREYQRTMADPIRAARRRETDRLRARRYREDPEYVARELERCRRWRKRKQDQDPDYFREYQRMQYRLQRERQGFKPRVFATLRPVCPHCTNGRRGYGGLCPWCNVPLGPFLLWLDAYQEESGIDQAVELASDLGLLERGLRRMLAHGQDHVEHATVDRALMNSRYTVEVDGFPIFGVDDLYPPETLGDVELELATA